MSQPTVHVLGVRHHGPGSARAVGDALRQLRPDLVVVEGCPELDAISPLFAHADLVPPVAGLVYAVDSPRQALFYPLAEFSPEWVAARWAVAAGVPLRFADLPAAHHFALDAAAAVSPDNVATEPLDPIGRLARAAGYDDPERWWEDAIEHRFDTPLERFDAVREAMAQIRSDDTRDASDPDVVENARREAAMRRVLRQAMRELDDDATLVMVCGAWHAPALHPGDFPPAAHDNRLLTKLPKVKVAAAWTPWTSARLARESGYGAGITSPGWYQHLFVHGQQPGADADDVAASWLVRVARTLRLEQLDAPTASVIEATRLARSLAALRGRPSVGLTELDDAAQAVLCHGSPLPLQLVGRELVVGSALGEVPEEAPIVPLAADLARLQRALRLKPTASVQMVSLDLRKPTHLARSVLLHRLSLLGIPWGALTDAGRTTGTFKEAWELEWRPELAVDVVEASLYGTTIEDAAAARAADAAAESEDLAALSQLVSQCLLADLPDGVRAVVEALARRAAVQHDVLALLDAVEPLARTCRYGDVRGADVDEVREILAATVIRACVGLPSACASLDDDAAGQMRTSIEGAHRGVSLLQDDTLDRDWRDALGRIAGHDRVHGTVAGRATRMLLDAGEVSADTAADRMSRRLSLAAPADQGAAWLDGFVAGDAVLLLHDTVLLGLIDDWVAGVSEETFEDLLPLLRRTFSEFSAPERRALGQKVSRLDHGGPSVSSAGEDRLDIEQARAGLEATARLLGWVVTS
jgi:hypothetical protein